VTDASDGDALALCAGQANTALAEEGVEALRQPVAKLDRVGRFGGALFRGVGNF
jgi:hypothetical protein